MNALLYIANKRKECFYENLKKLYETCPRLHSKFIYIIMTI